MGIHPHQQSDFQGTNENDTHATFGDTQHQVSGYAYVMCDLA